VATPTVAIADSKEPVNLRLNRSKSISSTDSASALLYSPDEFRESDLFLYDGLPLNSVDDFIHSDEKYDQMLVEYQGLANRYHFGGDDLDSLLSHGEQQRVAKHLFVFQAAKLAAKKLKHSPLYRSFRESFKRLRYVRDLSSFRVGADQVGKLSFQGGPQDEAEDGVEPLAEFKIHLTTNSGVEPRITFSNGLRLRYRAIQKDTILEYEVDF